jgi:poly(3-hydroxybutyrate) depolymerase
MASIAMAMRHSELIAAVCCVSASFITHPKFNYSPRPISLILGGLDSLVKPQGWFIPGYGLIFPSANSSFEALSELNQCTRDLFSEQLVPELDLPALKGGIQTRLSTGCKNNASIQFTTITTAGHMMFPNIMPELFPIGAINTTADTLDLTTMMWDSCRHHINPIDPFEVSMSPSLAPTPKPTFILTGMPTTSSASSLATGLCLSAMLGTWFGSIQ